MGWVEGFGPSRIRFQGECSTVELHPPLKGAPTSLHSGVPQACLFAIRTTSRSFLFLFETLDLARRAYFYGLGFSVPATGASEAAEKAAV